MFNIKASVSSVDEFLAGMVIINKVEITLSHHIYLNVLLNISKKKSIFDEHSHFTFDCFHLLLISQNADTCLFASFPFLLNCFIEVYQAAKCSFYDFQSNSSTSLV